MSNRERPILFSGPMVRAILEGRKTQTRRVVKDDAIRLPSGNGAPFLTECPYGIPGDRLWVRHRFWFYTSTGANPSNRHIWDEFTRTARWQTGELVKDLKPQVGKGTLYVQKPSIHMPRWASRITLEITKVRVERMQDISAKDIIAEGAVERPHNHEQFGKMPVSAFDGAYLDLRSLWQAGWDSINGKRGFGWGKNPWVWVIEFKNVQNGDMQRTVSAEEER